ncbi:hypothetical protein SD70_10335 [Gordoniibacillus kamchatkensis]|uniref:histidine kinase n=2 Tax=Gordoniibacillus kamchatkensis TaxID=1590651 RepID=A0ABR5AJ07_9BACL|nr:hypothetical protein SD70_10335 [Paenibacillus sp. VKM B-2647]
MADADTVALERMMRGIRLKDGSLAAIMDDKRKLIYASHALSASAQSQLAADNRLVKEKNESYSVVAETVSRSNWRIVVLFPESIIKKELQRIYGVGFLFAGFGLVIALLLYFAVSHWMVKPCKQMIQVMKRIQRGHLDTLYPVRGGDEMAQLGSSLNTMILHLRELIDREFRAALGRRNAEFRALQSQIQPHFLYNTLNGFIGLNRSGQSRLLERAILSLSGMLRYTLEQNDEVQLKEEFDFIAKYGELQRMRFAHKMELDIALDPEAERIPVPKLLIQPIVENAIIHGIEPCGRPCRLTIRARLRRSAGDAGAVLDIRISDNGTGYDPDKAMAGVGISNVRERLRYAYEDAVLRIESATQEGTTVTISIPLKEVNVIEAAHCR